MSGFTSPSILFLSTWAKQERDFILRLSQRLKERGVVTRVAEPYAGGFASSLLHRAAGFEADAMEASDVGLYSAIMGYACAGKDHHSLGVLVDGESVPLAGDPIMDAAILLHKQLEMRVRTKPNSDYWNGVLHHVLTRKDHHLQTLAEQVSRAVERLQGIDYEVRDIWSHVEDLKPREGTLVTCNPPTYKGAFEKFFDTNNRMTWHDPAYRFWDPPIDQPKFAEAVADADALFVVQQQAEPGKCAGEVVHARHLSLGQNVYFWTNKPDLVREVMGRSAIPRGGDLPRPDRRVLPRDYEITAESKVTVEKMEAAEARYWKELWLHKLTPSPALWDVGICVDGYLAGIAGLSRPMAQTLHNQWENLLLVYATAAPHYTRLTRMVTMLLMSRPILSRFVEPFQLAAVEQLITAELTKHPEIKGLRGLMKLDDRKPDPKHGYRLIYKASLTEQTEEEILSVWLAKEEAWLRKRQKAAA